MGRNKKSFIENARNRTNFRSWHSTEKLLTVIFCPNLGVERAHWKVVNRAQHDPLTTFKKIGESIEKATQQPLLRVVFPVGGKGSVCHM
jgi:hypothetical protein